MLPGHAPAHRVQPARRARAHHGAGDHVGRRDGVAEMGGRPEDRGAGRLGREALRRVDLRDPRPEGADDPPAAGIRPGRHRERGGDDHPGRRPREVGVEVTRGDERERDDAHRLLRVVRAVREGDEATGDELAAAEDAVDLRRRAPRHSQTIRVISGEGDGDARERRDQRRLQHLLPEARPLHHVPALRP